MKWVEVLVGLISRARALCGRAIRGLGVSERGIAVVETALVFPILFFLIAGMGEFGLIEINEIVLQNAAATGARYAATFPTSWSNAASPASNTIEGIILTAGAPITNSDASIAITYWVPNGNSSPTQCGKYSATSGGFVAMNGYTQSTCIAHNNLINIQLSYTYKFFTPVFGSTTIGMFPNGLVLTPSASAIDESLQ